MVLIVDGIALVIPLSPPNFGNLIAWYRADSVSHSGSTVTAWNDLSTSGANLSVGSGSSGPTYQATGFNGNPTVSFNGLNDWLISAKGAVNLAANPAKITCFLVGQFIAGVAGNVRLAAVIGTGANLIDYGNLTSVVPFLQNGTSNGLETVYNNNVYNPYSITPSTNYRFGMTINTSTTTAYLNGTSQGTVSSSTPTFGAASVGLGTALNTDGSGNPVYVNNPCQCLISEFVLYADALSGANITSLDNYFKSFWGL